MGFYDHKMTENQKKYIRLGYEVAISLMLVFALKWGNMAYYEGGADCNISKYKVAENYGLEDFVTGDIIEMPEINLTTNLTCCPC